MYKVNPQGKFEAGSIVQGHIWDLEGSSLLLSGAMMLAPIADQGPTSWVQYRRRVPALCNRAYLCSSVGSAPGSFSVASFGISLYCHAGCWYLIEQILGCVQLSQLLAPNHRTNSFLFLFFIRHALPALRCAGQIRPRTP